MSIKEKLDSKFGIQDPIHLAEFGGFPDTAFGYKGFSKVSNFVWDYESISPLRDVAYGRECRFQIPKGPHLVGPMYLQYDVSALTNGGGTSRFVDWAGYKLTDTVTLKYGSNQIQKFDWPVFHEHHKIYKNRDTQGAHEVAVAGNLSTTQRNTLAASAQTFLVPLPLYFTEHIQKFLNNEALSHELELIIGVSDLLGVTQATAGTTAGTLTAVTLRMLTVYLEDHERDMHVDRTLMGAGEVMAINDYETQLDNRLTAGQTTYYIPLTQLKGPTSCFTFTIKDAHSVDDRGLTTFEPHLYEYYPTMTWSVEAAGLQIYRERKGLESIYIHNAMFWAGPIGEAIYCAFPCLDIQDRINSYGHDNFSGFSNPKLKIVFSSALGADKSVNIINFTRNTTQLNKADLLKNFH